MEKCLLSIIIPIYNIEKYLDKCLESLVLQIKGNIEIILIDDGSTDNTKEICKEYCKKYKYIKYFHQKNSGVSTARNNGLKKAIGAYILFIDGDDWIIEGTIPKIIYKIQNNENLDIIAGDFVKENNNKIEKKQLKSIPKLLEYDYPNNLIKLFETNFFNPSLCCNVFKRNLFLENDIFLDERVKYTEDMDCTIQLFLKAKKIDLLEEVFYVYRQVQTSATHSSSLKRVDDTMNFVIKWHEKIEEIESEDLRKYLYNFVQYQYSIVVGMLFLLKKEERTTIYKKIKEYRELLKFGRGKKGKLVHIFYSIFGFNVVGKLMGIWIKSK